MSYLILCKVLFFIFYKKSESSHSYVFKIQDEEPYHERVWTELLTVTVHHELKDFNTRRRLLFLFFCTLTSNLTTKILFNVAVFSPFIYFCTFICSF